MRSIPWPYAALLAVACVGGLEPLGMLPDGGAVDDAPELRCELAPCDRDWPQVSAPTEAGSTAPDAAVTPAPDAGVPRVVDAGAPSAVDAGVPSSTDAGAPPSVDAGAPPLIDAGVAPSPDAGLPPRVDAGAPWSPQDAGTLSLPDAGPCTQLSGVVTTLTRGHYCVTGDVIIPTGVTLNVPAGTTFTVMGRYHFGRDPSWIDAEPPTIPGSGSLHAIGTAAEPIVFRGVTPDVGWYGIVISHSHDTVHLEHVTIRDAYKDDTNPSSRIWKRGGGLNSYVNVRGTIIRHSTFLNNRARSIAGALAINGHGSWPNAGPVEITDSVFEDNRCECRVYSGSSTDFCGGGAIRFSHVGGDANLVKLQRNVFRRNAAQRLAAIDAYGGAIGGFDDGIIIGPGNVFEQNAAATADGAITCNGQSHLGTIIDAVDPSVVFSGNAPDDGCGQ